MTQKITELKSNCWDVKSSSGNIYTVNQKTRLDGCGSIYFTMSCTCPGFKYRGHCKHIDAVNEEFEFVDEQASERLEY